MPVYVIYTPPGAPGKPVPYNVSGFNANVKFTDGSEGSNPIDGRRLAWSSSSGATPPLDQTTTGGDYIMSFSDGDTPIGSLTVGTTYYVWARCHSYAGWGKWSARAQFYTQQVPDAPSTPWFEDVQLTSVKLGWDPNFNGGSEINGYQVGWGTDPNTPQTYWNDVWPGLTITGLQPGAVYYFWVQARNSVGYSAWSGAAVNRTVAGAYVNDNGTWRLAIPYVKDGETWRLAQVWVKDQGSWKQTN